MSSTTFSIVAFTSTHDAIRSETEIKREGIACRLIPTPPEVSAGCGLALRIAPEDEEAVRQILARCEVAGAYYSLTRDGSERRVERRDC
ncbi:hypothetical protein ABB02_00772 [Clostridiaceae bacterium JG1575]|nr:hypothetical protein ABB02_00772 [Clostridiaceae bacterium JG1575]